MLFIFIQILALKHAEPKNDTKRVLINLLTIRHKNIPFSKQHANDSTWDVDVKKKHVKQKCS